MEAIKIMKKYISLFITVLFLTSIFALLPVFAEELPDAAPESLPATPTDLFPADDPAEDPAEIPGELPGGEPEALPEAEPELEPEVHLNAIMLRACDLLDAPGGLRIAGLEAGQSVIILNPGDVWTRIDTVDGIGWILTRDVALYNEKPVDEKPLRSISMSSDIEDIPLLEEGQIVTLTATLTGFDEDVYTIRWQYSPDGGETAIDIQGATATEYCYTLTRENFGYLYRVVIICEDPETLEGSL